MDAALAVLAQGGTVVTANNRLARAIELAHNGAQAAAGRRTWPTAPVFPWQAWLERLWWLSFMSGGEAGRRGLIGEVQARALWRDIVGEHGGTGLPPTPGAAAELAARAWRLCQDWQIGPAALAEAADSDDSRTFAAWAQQYVGRCARDGWVDARMAVPGLARDLQDGRIRVASSVCLAGFDELPPLHRQLAGALTAGGTEVLLSAAPARGSGGVQLACRDEQQELEWAARWARWHRERNPAGTVGIVVPDLAGRRSQVRREFLDVFAPDWRLQPARQWPVNFSLGEPLASTGVGRAALLVLRCLRGWIDYRELGELLASPYLCGWAAEGDARARLELAVRERRGQRVNLRELAVAPPAAAPIWLGRLGDLLAAAPGAARLGADGWAVRFQVALQAMGWPGDRALGSDEYQGAAAVRDLLGTFGSCARVTGAMDLGRALGLLESLAEEQVFQPAGHAQSVQVLGVREAIGQCFDHLWICGLTSSAWPPAVWPEPLLGLSLQRSLRLPESSPAAGRERAERQLRWLIGGAGDLVVSWPRLRGEELQTVSPLVEVLAPVPPEQVPRWPGIGRREALLRLRQLEELSPDPAPAVTGAAPFRGGIALLERQARCPARAFVEFRLGGRELQTPSAGIDAATRGSVTHAVLEQFFGRVGDHAALCALDAKERDGLLHQLIDRELRRHLPGGDPVISAMARLEARRQHGLLSGFIEMERQRSGFRILWMEQLPPGPALPPAVDALRLTLRPDRVDELPDGRKLVIDYKTGRKLPSARDLCGPRPRAPQLPLYATAAGADGVAFVQLTPGLVRWHGIGDSGWNIPGVVDPERWTRQEAADWSELRASWWTALERLAREFLDGAFTVDRWRQDDARGQWAMAIRAQDLPDDEEAGPA